MPTTNARKAKSAPRSAEVEQKEPHSLWSLHGMEDVYFQREAQVNFWTVMGGLQIGVLLTQTGALWEQLQAGRWYLVLYLLASLLIIALMWASTAWGSLVLKWTVNIPNIITGFFGNFAMAIACLLIVNPAGWFLSLAIAATGNWLHQFLFYRLGAWGHFSAETKKQLKINLWVYGLWPLICFAGAIQLFVASSAIAETVWGAIVLIVVINALFRQHHGMERERKELGIP
jgi:hypothetical protein